MTKEAKIDAWNIDLVHKLMDLHTIQLKKTASEYGVRQALKSVKSSIGIGDVKINDEYEQMDFAMRCFVFLRYGLFDRGIHENEYEQILNVYKSLLDQFKISSHHSSPLHVLHVWSEVFQGMLCERQGMYSQVAEHILQTVNMTQQADVALAEQCNLMFFRAMLRIGRDPAYQFLNPELLNFAELLCRSEAELLKIDQRYKLRQMIEHVSSVDAMHSWLIKDYNWSYHFYLLKKPEGEWVKSFLKEREWREPRFYLQAYLYLLAHGDWALVNKMPKLDTIRRFDSDAVKNGGADSRLFDFLNKALALINEKMSRQELHESLSNLSVQIWKMESSYLELLASAALVNIAAKVKSQSILPLLERTYLWLSKIYTGDQNDNYLELKIAHSMELQSLHKPVEQAKTIQRIRDGKVERFGVVAKMVTELAVDRIKGSTKKAFATSSRKKQIEEDLLRRSAGILVRALGELKGPYMKLGQIISTIALDLPDGVESEMGKILTDTIPMETAYIIEIVEKELGASINDLFAEFNNHPLASASIGQIHRARLKDGTEVVVKVQFPEMEKIIKNDGATALLLKPIYRSIFPMVDIDALMDETNRKLLQECDYRIEKEYQKKAREISFNYQNIYVPKIYDEYSTKKVLVMEYVEGRKFYDFLATANDEERSQAATAIIRFLIGAFFHDGLVNGDPHPGNFLFMNDGQVCVIDYGFSDFISMDRRLKWARLLKASLENNATYFREVSIDIGMVGDPDKFNFNVAMNRIGNIMRLGMNGPERLDSKWVRDSIQSFTVKAVNRKYLTLDTAEVVSSRFLLCLFSILLKMEPYVSLGQIFQESMNEFLDHYNANESQKEGIAL